MHACRRSITLNEGIQTGKWLSGAKVGLCELPLNAIASDQAGGMGGTCVLRGCIPKKFMVYAGEFTDECQDAEAYGCAPYLVFLDLFC